MPRRNNFPGENQRSPGGSLALALLGRGILVLALFVGASGALLLAYAAAASSPALSVKKPLVSGTRYLSRFEVLSAAGVGAHSNLAALPVGLLEQRVAGLNWVKSVQVQRRLPATVEIKVVEHEPSHVALVEGRLYYLNQDMSAYAPLKPGESPPDRPLITGLSKTELVDPDAETQSLLDQASRLLEALPAGAVAEGGGLSEIHLDRVWGLSLIWQHLAATVRLGRGGYAAKLDRLGRVSDDLKARGELQRVSLSDLSDERRAVVRFGG